jgi:phenylpyruvate tautomerase PptA (4-oxalocrotonate tautomerase family)
MPVIEIAALPPAHDLDVAAALGAVTRSVAAFIDEDPVGTWAVFLPIAPGHFAEGEDAPASQPVDTHPALVRVFADRPADQVPALLETVGSAVVDALGLAPGNVFVRLEPAIPQHLYTG